MLYNKQLHYQINFFVIKFAISYLASQYFLLINYITLITIFYKIFYIGLLY